jgi:hypothetical protein
MAINADDLRIEPWAAAGDQHIGAGANGINVTHIPSVRRVWISAKHNLLTVTSRSK